MPKLQPTPGYLLISLATYVPCLSVVVKLLFFISQVSKSISCGYTAISFGMSARYPSVFHYSIMSRISATAHSSALPRKLKVVPAGAPVVF